MKRLNEKWGSFIKGDLINKQIVLNEEKQVYLNILYKPINYKKDIFKELNSKTFNELNTFYKEYNGINLCSHSLIIFGIDNVGKEDGYATKDIFRENVMISTKIKNNEDNKYVFFGNYGMSTYLAFDRNNPKEVYVLDNNKLEVLHTFNTFSEMIEHAINFLTNEYTENGKKINIDEKYNGIMLQNTSQYLI